MEDVKEKPGTENGEDFSELMKEFNLKSVDSNTPVEGYIIDFINDGAIIDIGQKTEGILNRDELLDWDGEMNYKIGDKITVIAKQVNTKEGYILVSKRQVDAQKGWEKILEAYDKSLPMKGKIIKMVEDKRGFIVDMGVEMFLPLSQLDIKKVKNPQNYLGKEFEFKISKINPKERGGVVSRRSLLEEERKEKIEQLFDSLQVDDVIKGTVTSIVDYGAFIDIGCFDAFIHKDNISYGRINHPKEKLRKGDEIEAKILELDKENTRISLGIKQRFPDPWVNIEEKYPVGQKVVAKVTKIVSFGAFIELEEGVEGLLHISDLTWEGKPNTVEEYVAVGDKLWVQVIELHSEEKKIKLGLKQLEMRPEEKYMQNHRSNEVVQGLVKKILKSRVFVELEENVEGVIKISDISYFHIDSPKEFLKENETIDVMIIADELDPNYKVRLGLKHLSNPEWDEFFQKNRSGSILKVKIKKMAEMGISVEISKNIEGFVRYKEVGDTKLTPEEIAEKYKVGDVVDAIILNTDRQRKRIYLSFKAVARKREREEIEKYSKSTNEPVTTIGDLLQNEIDKKK
jgi:small subunit ribosomal protein S1